MFRVILLSLFVLLLMTSAAHGQDQPKDTDTVKVEHNIAYAPEDPAMPSAHLLDLYIPEGAKNYPVLIFFHGGVWKVGSKDEIANVGPAFASQGIGVILMNYRLSPKVVHPAHIQDAASVFAWTVDHIADYGGDPTRIVVSGTSAGGQLASLLALDDQYLKAVGHSTDEILAVLPLSGVFVIDDWIWQYAAGAFAADKSDWADASPYNKVKKVKQPFLLLAAENDYPELIVETKDMAKALKNAGVTVDMAIIPNRDHYTMVSELGTEGDTATQRMTNWLKQVFAQKAIS